MSREKQFDLETVEFFVRSHMLRAGARCLEQLIETMGRGRRREALVCADNHLPTPMRSRGVRRKTIRTILGCVTLGRSLFVCPACGQSRYPADELLGVGFSPGAEDLRLLADLWIDAKGVERVAEDIGRAVDDWMGRQGSAASLSRGASRADRHPLRVL